MYLIVIEFQIQKLLTRSPSKEMVKLTDIGSVGDRNVCSSNYLSRLLLVSLSLSASRDPLIEILVPRREKERGSVSMSIEGD